MITGNSDMNSQEMTVIKPDNITDSHTFPSYRYPLDDVGEASGKMPLRFFFEIAPSNYAKTLKNLRLKLNFSDDHCFFFF